MLLLAILHLLQLVSADEEELISFAIPSNVVAAMHVPTASQYAALYVTNWKENKEYEAVIFVDSNPVTTVMLGSPYHAIDLMKFADLLNPGTHSFEAVLYAIASEDAICSVQRDLVSHPPLKVSKVDVAAADRWFLPGQMTLNIEISCVEIENDGNNPTKHGTVIIVINVDDSSFSHVKMVTSNQVNRQSIVLSPIIAPKEYNIKIDVWGADAHHVSAVFTGVITELDSFRRFDRVIWGKSISFVDVGTVEMGMILHLINEIEADQYQLRSHRDFMSKATVVVDIGAHIGLQSIVIANEYPNLRIFAFEPAARNYRCLTANVEEYNRIVTYNLGIAARAGVANIYYHPAVSVLATTVSGMYSDPGFASFEINTTDITSIPALVGGHIHLLKLDCEGCEFEIFHLIPWSDIDAVVGEFHPAFAPNDAAKIRVKHDWQTHAASRGGKMVCPESSTQPNAPCVVTL